MKKLLFFWKELIATFWFIPVLLLFFAIILSIGLVTLDNAIEIEKDGLFRFFLVNSSDSARSILTTISGAMIGVAGTVFSVTLVALTLASSQFGPRLIKNFMYVRLNQVVLGSYIATYLYCLLILNSIRDNDGYSFIPSISILVAIFAAIANIILLIIFIHQIAVSIQADKVIFEISKVIAKQVETIFPEKMGEMLEEEEEMDVEAPVSEYPKSILLKSSKTGYIQYIDGENLLETVAKRDSLFRLEHRPGSYIVKSGRLGVLYSHTEWEQKELEKLIDNFVIGETKTSQQDLEFSIHQMVEIAARALSPGVNDPYTAIACIDNLTSTICHLAEAKFPPKYRADEDGKLRVIADVLEFEGAVSAAFNQIRQFSKDSPAVIIRLMEAMITILNFTRKKSQEESVLRHARMILTLGKESIKEKDDLKDLMKRAELIDLK